MRLLILTQKVDIDDPVLGFFHNWLEKFSGKFESIVVICLEKGVYELPPNVKVLSLGKEEKHVLSIMYYVLWKRKILYVLRFYKYIWRERGNYDAVFVHMNQEYVLLGWEIWKLWGKKIYLWRNHKQGSLFTRLAVLFSNKVFYTSLESYTAMFKKAVQMPVGIDTSVFNTESGIMNYELRKNKILSLGRISPVKNIHLLIEALNILSERGLDFGADIYGDALPKDQKYFEDIKKRVKEFNLEKKVRFYNAVPNYKTPEIYQSHEIFMNLTPSGSFDKTILEASACGCLPIVMNGSLSKYKEFTYLVAKSEAEDMADRLALWLKADSSTKSEKQRVLQELVLEQHSLKVLIDKLSKEII